MWEKQKGVPGRVSNSVSKDIGEEEKHQTSRQKIILFDIVGMYHVRKKKGKMSERGRHEKPWTRWYPSRVIRFHSFVQYIFMEHLLEARRLFRNRGYYTIENKIKFLFL